jgi:hypothetical protein
MIPGRSFIRHDVHEIHVILVMGLHCIDHRLGLTAVATLAQLIRLKKE